MPAEWHALAESELNDVATYYKEQDRPAVALVFLDEARRVVDIIVAQPDGGRPLREGLRAWHLRKFPYSIIYRALPDIRVRILAVAGDRQRPFYWSRRS